MYMYKLQSSCVLRVDVFQVLEHQQEMTIIAVFELFIRLFELLGILFMYMELEVWFFSFPLTSCEYSIFCIIYDRQKFIF
jgi:hypothetical protein